MSVDPQHDDDCDHDPCPMCRFGPTQAVDLDALREARDVARRALDLLRRECGKTWMRPEDMQLMRELEQMVGTWPWP